MRPPLAVLAAALLLAGCGGHGGGSSSPDPSSGRDACSLNEFAPNYGGGISLVYWPTFPLNVYFDATTSSYTTALQAQSVTAFDGWVDQTGDRVQFNVVTDESEADIVVGYVSLSDPLLSGYDADGITYFDPGSTASGATADQEFESIRIYIGIDGNTTREFGTMAHEFGHALGIHGHSPDALDVMYYAWSPERSQTPTTRDVNTLYTAYCGDFATSTAGKSATTHRTTPFPPITAPGWVAIP